MGIDNIYPFDTGFMGRPKEARSSGRRIDLLLPRSVLLHVKSIESNTWLVHSACSMMKPAAISTLEFTGPGPSLVLFQST